MARTFGQFDTGMTGGFKASQRAYQFGLLVLLVIAMIPSAVGLSWPLRSLAWSLFAHEDLFALPLLIAVSLWPLSARPAPGAAVWARLASSRGLLLCGAVALLVLCRVGHDLVFLGSDFTRDERMADFDAYIFAHGRLWWATALAWRPFYEALNAEFMLPVAGNAAWISGYLPVNAALRAGMALLGDAALTSPLLVVLGAIALSRTGQRLWPGDAATLGVALLLYACTPQILVTGMTSYAMSGHLALNLIWLALFLRGGRIGHAGAIFTGFLATGLHEPLFHPLFALPFLALLVHRRRWSLAAIYLAAYAAISLFWLTWPHWISTAAGHGIVVRTTDQTGFGGRLLMLVRDIHPDSAIWLTALNLLRFLTWQHLLLLPLALYGLGALWRRDPFVLALIASVALPLLACAVLLPYQGNGWGYRYLHGAIGSLCLLGGYGWRTARDRGIDPSRLLLWSTLATIVLLLPLRAKAAHDLAAPLARLDERIATSGADVVLIADDAGSFGSDLVANSPDLARPIRFKLSKLDPALAARLCARHPRTILIGPADFAEVNAAHFTRGGASGPVYATIRMVEAAGCVPVQSVAAGPRQ